MSNRQDPEKPKRQGKRIPKTAYHFRIQDVNYDWLCEVSRRRGASIAKVLNAILRAKPEPDDYFLR